MENEIFIDYVLLHVDSKKLPPLKIKDADFYLHSICEKLESNISVCVDIEVVFTDGLKISESFTLKKCDALIDNIIRYHLVGIIKFKAGLVDTSKNIGALAGIDTSFYLKLFYYYSFFYNTKKEHTRSKGGKCSLNAVEKLKNKYNKYKKRDLSKIYDLNCAVQRYEGILVGLDTVQEEKNNKQIKCSTELLSVPEGTVKHAFLNGVLEGMNMTNDI